MFCSDACGKDQIVFIDFCDDLVMNGGEHHPLLIWILGVRLNGDDSNGQVPFDAQQVSLFGFGQIRKQFPLILCFEFHASTKHVRVV